MVPVDRTADVAISRSARVSYLTGDKSKDEDERLVKYLMEHCHTSPFESIEFKFEIKCPIFVERQLVRHRTASLNEASYRYSQAPNEFYFPELRGQDQNNKQSSIDFKTKENVEADKIWKAMQTQVTMLHESYEKLLKLGVAREVARCALPVSLMTTISWKCDLKNLLHFLGLRTAPDAQQEIRDLANAMLTLIKPRVPVAIRAWENVQLGIRFTVEEAEWAKGISIAPAKKQKDLQKKLDCIITK
jgi:thymidylate synthase (FAD)